MNVDGPFSFSAGEIPVNDVMTKNGKLREDGRLVRDMYAQGWEVPVYQVIILV